MHCEEISVLFCLPIQLQKFHHTQTFKDVEGIKISIILIEMKSSEFLLDRFFWIAEMLHSKIWESG